MTKLSIKLENCYGIRTFEQEFTFEKSRANLIYAPNGVMKTSLAKTFLRLSKGEIPEEKVYNRESKWEIKIDNLDINAEEVLVVEPFNPSFNSQNISTLLVNREKKIRYDRAYKSISDTKKKLITSLNKLSGLTKDSISDQLTKDFDCANIFEAIKKVKSLSSGKVEYSNIKYKDIFDAKVLSLLNESIVKDNIEDYAQRYNELIQESPIFQKTSFNIIGADAVKKTLKKERFFEADHKVVLNGDAQPIETADELENVIENAKTQILNDENLQHISKKIINGVASIKTFQGVLEDFPEMAANLSDIDEFRRIIWASYYLKEKELFESCLSEFEKNRAELVRIEQEASVEETLWYETQKVFKERFFVPFEIEVENHTNAILGTSAPNIAFIFRDDENREIRFDRGQLDSLNILSVGERRAMYLLFVIFEFTARQLNNEKTVAIIDDIGDSFDYKNKYAIIEYLKELSNEENFCLIVLTHNFDFYKTFQSRVLDTAKWTNSFVAQKTDEGHVKLLTGGSKNISDPFSLWRNGYGTNAAMFISMIPFVRNLVEYKDGIRCQEYLMLTQLLHIKNAAPKHTLGDLDNVICNVVNVVNVEKDFNREIFVVDYIFQTANNLCESMNYDEICLENKVVFSIAIRLKAEEYMFSKTNNLEISSNQTSTLYNKYLDLGTNDPNFFEAKKVLSQVILMTPENIHINSFMYEPLMDMSGQHLVKLYNDVKSL